MPPTNFHSFSSQTMTPSESFRTTSQCRKRWIPLVSVLRMDLETQGRWREGPVMCESPGVDDQKESIDDERSLLGPKNCRRGVPVQEV